jgi:CheY-like chemotaxis protein
MTKKKTILLIEDNEGDVVLTREALKESKIKSTIEVIRDGDQAMQHFFSRNVSPGKKLPDLILLDIHLPRKNGFEVLEKLKSDERLRLIPVVILSTSDAERDIERAYSLGANSFVTKPVDFNDFTEILGCIEEYWFSIARIPSQ